MSSRRLALVALVPALVALPVGTGAAKTPKPRKSIAAWAKQWQTAGHAGDCTFLGAVYHFDATDAKSCAFYTSRLGRVKVIGTQQFGTGAIVRWSASGYQNGIPRESVLWSVRAGASAWKDTSTVTGIFGYFGSSTIRTKPAHVKAMNAAAAAYVKILRTKSCTRLYALERHPQHTTKAAQCKGTFAPDMVALLQQKPHAKPVRLGGNRVWGVYELDLGSRYLTIPMGYGLDHKLKVLTWYDS